MNVAQRILLSLVMLAGCALPTPDTTRQDVVSEVDVAAIRDTREGLLYMQSGRYLDAEMLFEKALILKPDAEPILTNKAVALFMQDRFDEAYALFQDLSAQDPSSSVYAMWLGRTMIQQGREAEGISLLEKAAQAAIEKEDGASAAVLYRTLAAVYFEYGREEDAICASSAAFGYAPTAQEALHHSRLLMALGYPQNAAFVLQGFFGAATLPSVEAHLVFAEVSLLMSDLPAAVNFLRDALFLQPQDPDSVFLSKLLVLLVGTELAQQGVESNLEVFNADVQKNLLDDDRLTGAQGLYVPPQILGKVSRLQRQSDASFTDRLLAPFYKLKNKF